MGSHWLQWTCCGILPFGRSGKRYKKILDIYEDNEDRIRAEIDMGLPPGVTLGDLLRNQQNEESLKQAYLLAVQSNNISDYLRRFDTVKIPQSCQHIVSSQISKLKSVQHIIWNTMISIAIGNITIDDSTLKALLHKQAGESVALLEMEKLAAAIHMDMSKDWAAEIAAVVTEAPRATNNFKDPIYDIPEEDEATEMTPLKKNYKPLQGSPRMHVDPLTI
ncbi:tegument protein UL51 [Vespertilionid gammaherpesvirus 1]|uniref:Tegument protein UL51 n=1 Tax=Vespertilionid gammaherpesvirus 1 TaxID=2560830 RepID=A0A0X9XSN4_9GAMA|nr:tegument protein UL51 [Myotis gammaherpesvirus 8]AMA67412.1 tegument protein UL51 [Vespertilionid gammaherpesvirus 1]